MSTNIRLGLLLSLILFHPPIAQAAGQDREPALRIEAGGPTAYVTSLVFGPQEKSLYAAGYDKLVHAWSLDRDGKFAAGRDAYRVPLGPGLAGSINSLALSSDGVWLAVASRGVVRGTAGFRQLAIYVPGVAAMSPEMWEDQGTILVYNTRTGDARELRGHRGRVVSLAFAPVQVGRPPLLASVAREFHDKDSSGAARLWDVAAAKEIAHLTDLPDLTLAGRPLWPHLCLWSSGTKGDVVRVALAWEDGKLRLWDVKDGKGRVTEAKDGDFNNTVARVPGKEQVLTGSFRDGKGQLTLGDLSGPAPVVLRQATMLPGQRPRSIALFAAPAGGAVNRAAVVFDAPIEGSKEFDYLVRFVDLAELKPVRASLVLWTGPAMAPTAAVSPNGRFLAAAGNKDHEVLVFALADVPASKDQKQTLRGLGALIQSAAFVKKEKDVGLFLNETAGEGQEKGQPAPPKRGDLIFDFTHRKLAEANGWKLDTPDLTGWDVKPSTLRDEKKRIKEHILEVSRNGEAVGTVHLKPSEFIDAFALLPGADKRPPLLAVAIVEFNQPILRLYDAHTGQHVRELTGHVNRIHSLSFAANGKLLASAAEDQTVCLWGLANLDDLLGVKGMIHGLIVSERGKELVLARLDEAAVGANNLAKLTAAGVREGDVIEGLVVKDKLQPTATIPAFYNAVFLVAPGQSVALRIAKRGDVSLQVGQATDGHRPLLTLFVTRPSKGGVRHWIGWNPVGPYDFSDRDAEQLLGWQQNTGDAKQPALFAEAREYRDVHFKPDILRYLVERGDTGRAVEAWKIDHPAKVREPSLTLWIKEIGPDAKADAAGRLLLEQPQVTLQLTVNELPAEQIRSITWQRGSDRGELTRTADGDWSADLSRLAWKRGDHKVRVLVKTIGDGREPPRELMLHYQPPRPVVAMVGVLPRVVDKEEYVLEARVEPGAGQEVQLSLTQQHDGKEVHKDTRKITKTETVREKFTLREGLNQLKVLARNRDANDDAAESDALSVEVRYKPKTPPPQISVTAVAPFPDGPVLRPDPARLEREPLVVDTPAAVIVGSVESLKPLTAVSFLTDAKGDKEQTIPLDKAKPLQLALAQKVALPAPGQTLKITFFATADGVRVERSLVLRYEPRLPEMRLTSPVEAQPLFEGKDPLTIRVDGRLIWPDEQCSCTAQVIVNDKAQYQPSKLAGVSSVFSAAATLQPGENWVQVRLKNDWHETTTPKLLVSYRRPPRVVSFTAPAQSLKPFVDAVVLVESPKTLPLTTLRVQGHEVASDRLAPTASQQKGDITVWRIALKELPLQKGKNVLSFQAGNQDGWALQPAETTVLFEEPVPPKATVELLNPLRDAVVDDSEFAVEYLIRSSSPLKKVEVQRNGVIVFQKEKADLAAVVKNAAGQYELRESRKVVLQSGTNPLKVVVQNDGGEQESHVVALTSQAGPVKIQVTALDTGEEVGSVGFHDGKVLFPTMRQAKVVVKGNIKWGPASDEQAARLTQVRIYVNGCQQPPVLLERPSGVGRERTFRAEVQLTRAKDNYLTVKLPDLAEDSGSRNQCVVDCAQPEVAAVPRRQAHLLILDTSREGERSIVGRILQSLQATAAGENRFSKEGFADGGRIYGPLVGAEVAPERVYKQLVSIKRNLKLRAAAGASHDVVFVYFHGGEALDAQGHFLRTADAERDPELRWSGLPCENLRRYCADNLGAQLVLLDVTREARPGGGSPQDKVLQWPDDPSVAVFRYSWNGPPLAEPLAARLVHDLAGAMTRARDLRDVVRFFKEKFKASTERLQPWPSEQFKEQLTYSELVPPGLEDIVLSGR